MTATSASGRQANDRSRPIADLAHVFQSVLMENGRAASKHIAGAVKWLLVAPILPATLVLSGCVGMTEIPTNCDYKAVAEQAIADRYPWFLPKTPLKLARKGAVVEAHYPLPHVMPGGTAYTDVRVHDCSVAETWLTQ
jgi:hypothetical protein